MSQTIENKIISRIFGRGTGCTFTKTYFEFEFGEANIHQALSSLTKAGKIRCVCKGATTILATVSYWTVVVHALARKFNWRIQPSGDAALNLLGLSTQVPGRWVYLSDGPGREYEIGNHFLVFKKFALEGVGIKYRESGLVMQVLKAIGQEHMDQKVSSVSANSWSLKRVTVSSGMPVRLPAGSMKPSNRFAKRLTDVLGNPASCAAT